MELSELTAYAAEQYHMQEQHRAGDLPGSSVLVEPTSGQCIAFLMRQWDFDTGTEIQRCDLKCGRQPLWESPASCLSLPCRMTGQKWLGVRFDENTDAGLVCRLLDRAVREARDQGCTIVVDLPPAPQTVIEPRAASAAGRPFTLSGAAASPLPPVPPKIREMMRLYAYGDGSFAQKCKNFVRQAQFMADYEDDLPWSGAFQHYFPTYHDLSIPQLRGYFTFRTQIRKGSFPQAPLSFLYLYLYELLNGVGVASPADGLQKMQAVEQGFLEARTGDAALRRNLHFWMLAYSVLHGLPAEQARAYASPLLLAQDEALAALRTPQDFDDDAIFDALCALGGKKISQSPVIRKEGARGRRLVAAVWRLAAQDHAREGKKLFTACFGTPHSFRWYPMSNAVYWEAPPHPDADYILDPCRSYHCRKGVWKEKRFNSLYFNKPLLHSLLRGADRFLRRELKTGHYLRENKAEDWVAPYVEQALAEERQAALRVAKPPVTIRLSALEQIRHDASITRDSLLTEADLDDFPPSPPSPAAPLPAPDAPKASQQEAPATQEAAVETAGGPDMPYREVLVRLLHNEPAEPYLADHRLLPSVVADAINEALWEMVGDSVLECDGNTLCLVEDYRADVQQIMGGKETEA